MEALSIFQESIVAAAALAGFVGLAVGSFLNVVAHRLPIIMERRWHQDCAELGHCEAPTEEPAFSLMRPRSRCPHCGHRIGASENIPVLSWLMLRGRCKGCAGAISPRYPIVEALTGLLSIWVVLHFGPGQQALAALLFTWLMVPLVLIDLDTFMLPDDLTLPGVWIGLLLALVGVFADLESAVIGAAAGYLSLWSVERLYCLASGRDQAMGAGDFKLFALFGAWMGWQALPSVILLASGVGAVVGISMMLFRGAGSDVKIPFGPYLAAAGWIALLYGPAINHWYLEGMGIR